MRQSDFTPPPAGGLQHIPIFSGPPAGPAAAETPC
jgi:hypothetical protein